MKKNETKQSDLNIRTLAVVAMLTALSYILNFLEPPIPCSPFLKLDPSDFPAVVAAFAFNPIYGVVIEALKNVLRAITTSSTMGIGELANFLMGSAFILTASLLKPKKDGIKNTVVPCLIACIAMGIAGALSNYFIFLPLYIRFMNMTNEMIVGMVQSFFSFIDSKEKLCAYYFFSFNVIKGLVITLFTVILYPKVSSLIKKKK